jgi:multidrug efflux pump subunit AcrA (membrane-fusion protein)
MLATIKQGDSCSLSIPSLGLSLSSTIRTIYPTVDPTTLQIPLEISFDSSGHTLYPGQFAEAIISSSTADRLLIPVNAIQYDSKGPWVFLMVEDKSKQQRISIGQHFDNRVEIISGLEPDMMVITRGFVGLRPGKKVQTAGTDNSDKADK